MGSGADFSGEVGASLDITQLGSVRGKDFGFVDLLCLGCWHILLGVLFCF